MRECSETGAAFRAGVREAKVEKRRRNAPSSKFEVMVNEIEEMEERAAILLQRNISITKRLMQRQRNFVEKAFFSTGKALLRKFFEGWRDSLREISLESQLDEHNNSLTRVQEVVAELGAALEQEKADRKANEAVLRERRIDLERAMQQEKQLEGQFREQQAELEILEQRVQAAEACLKKSKAEAQAVIDSTNTYDQSMKELEGLAPLEPDAIEYGIRLREEAENVMQKFSDYLPNRSKPSSPSSPAHAPWLFAPRPASSPWQASLR